MRLLIFGAALAALALISLIAIRSSVQATSGGDPYTTPKVVDTNSDPRIVETTLVAKNATVNVGNGVTARAETINGQIPGPTFSLKVGDTVIVHYQNKLDEVSGLHWHGIELPNEVDGTPFTQNQVPPGGSFLYKFKVTRPGIFWYHPHHHSSTNQVFKGLYGAIIVKDPNGDALRASGVLPPAANTRVMVLSDTTVCKDARDQRRCDLLADGPLGRRRCAPRAGTPDAEEPLRGPRPGRAPGQPLPD